MCGIAIADGKNAAGKSDHGRNVQIRTCKDILYVRTVILRDTVEHANENVLSAPCRDLTADFWLCHGCKCLKCPSVAEKDFPSFKDNNASRDWCKVSGPVKRFWSGINQLKAAPIKHVYLVRIGRSPFRLRYLTPD